ncbi:glycine/betaine ABC transporter ATP-binding protein [Bacillus coahuilensis m2-6]|uniref:ABC transporter ATP-binding protein n=1 Tax=Bacillus coahuilensis TaxID=408580 RepID=UPI0001850F0B|nr:betaine/proline/choline family ABC transporter ATP-binding protein [Bacillus coahuilensis]KUP08229.1 glycine/betaine ABC transporter ATP-binding protein [Bacillus coahuilensis m2-6]
MILFENVSKQFEDGTKAVDKLNLSINEGELIALIGPSGCGKTTTMKMINKLLLPTEGSIYINGEDISKVDEVKLRRNIGYVIQRIGLLPHMTIEENIALIPKLNGWTSEKWKPRVDELLNLVGLDPNTFRHRYPLELSGGQQQRVGVIRALAAEPPIILMDEPFSALDPISREQLQDELKRIQEQIHKTIIFVTHDMDEALKIADRIVLMREGRIEQIATPDELLQSPANTFVEDFIGVHRRGVSENKEMKTIESLDLLPISDTNHKTLLIDSKSTIKEAIELLLTHRAETAVIHKNDQPIGTISKDLLLTELANLSMKGGTIND